MTPSRPAAEVAKERIARRCGLEPSLLEDAYPCTSLQARLLVASLNGLAQYVSTFVFDISSGSHEPSIVKTSFEHLYDQTPVLRTRFFETRGKFLQVVAHSSVSWIEHNDLSTYLEQDSQRPVDLGDSLARFAWVDEGRKTYMVWTLHHALYDEWSISLLFQDLSLLALKQETPRRPGFSKFVKSLSLIDHPASRTFWKRKLADIDAAKPILSEALGSFRTSDCLDVSYTLKSPKSSYQNSTLAIAAWSILLSVLSGSDIVSFGNIVNGRASDVPGVVDICGPTMTTVPNVLKVPFNSSVGDFIKELETTRSEMLPFEQTGLDEHREIVGAPNFDTLLSIRSSIAEESIIDPKYHIRPQSLGKRHISHPCCIYLDMVFGPDECVMTASFDERYIDKTLLHKALEQISSSLQLMSDSTSSNLREFAESLQLPRSLEHPSVAAQHEVKHASPQINSEVDGKILERVYRVAQHVSPLKNNKFISPESSLQEIGLDSMGTVVLARRLGEIFKTTIPFKYFAGRQQSVTEVARTIQTILHGSDDDHNNDGRIALLEKADEYIESIEESAKTSDFDHSPSAILLTGATGFLGIEILRECLSSTDDTIVLPVRCDDPDDGLRRIRRAATISQWKESDLALLDNRVRIWPSDLSSENIGLDSKKTEELKSIRTIIHNGARVDFLLDYHDLEVTNVSSTNFLLTTHLDSVAKPSFVYVTGGRGCHLIEEDLSTTASRLAMANGYAQTKFTGELLMHHAHQACTDNDRKAAISIIHPGIVLGSESTGVANTDDFIWRYVAASVQMRAYVPAVPTKREWMSLTTVSSVASTTVSRAIQHKGLSQVERHSVHTGLFVSRFWEVVIAALDEEGSPLQPVSERVWLKILREDLRKRGKQNPLFSLSELLLEGTMKGIGRHGPRPDHRESGEDVTSIERAIAANVKYLKGIGYFKTGTDRPLDDSFGRSRR